MNTRFRRVLAPALSLLCLFPALSGCESMKEHRKQSDEAAKTTDESSQADATKPSSFFKPTRLSGGLSSESRDIERQLGVGVQ